MSRSGKQADLVRRRGRAGAEASARLEDEVREALAPHPSTSELESIARLLLVKEAIASVAASHTLEDPDCDCTTCRAAEGDERAFLEVLMAVRDLEAADEAARREEAR
jgi:hypothetical protein